MFTPKIMGHQLQKLIHRVNSTNILITVAYTEIYIYYLMYIYTLFSICTSEKVESMRERVRKRERGLERDGFDNIFVIHNSRPVGIHATWSIKYEYLQCKHFITHTHVHTHRIK